MLSFIRTHKFGVGTGALVAIAGLAWLAFGFFGVHTLFIDDVVDEAGPVFDAAPAAALETDVDTMSASSVTDASDVVERSSNDPSTAAADDDAADDATTVTSDPAQDAPPDQSASPAIITEYTGTFQGDAHPTAGTASVLGNGTGQRFLRLEQFETDNGPDLNVYLVNSSTGDVSDYIDLGDLKGNIGDQNYEIPEGVDLSVYDEVVIWCVRFGVGFGDALLAAV